MGSLVVGAAVALAALPQAGVADAVETSELGRLEYHPGRPWERISPDGLHIAWVTPDGDGFRVVVDGTPGQLFDEIGAIPTKRSHDRARDECATFSGDSTHVAYIVRRGARWHAVIDGRAERGHDTISFGPWWAERQVFSPDGTRHAYVAGDRGQKRLVLNGRPGPAYKAIMHHIFSPDSRRIAYVAARDDGRHVVVLDGEPVGEGVAIAPFSLTFSPDSRRFAYAREKGRKGVFVDGERWPLRGEVAMQRLLFSPDSRHLAYFDVKPRLLNSRRFTLVMDGERGASYYAAGFPNYNPATAELC